MTRPLLFWTVLGLLLCVLVLRASAAVIETDTVWQGTVAVTEETLVLRGVTLMILPGTRVLFRASAEGEGAAAAQLTVRGRLLAQGRADAEILFTSAAAEPNTGDWGGLLFQETGRQEPSRLSYCRVEFASQGIRAGVTQLQVEHSTVRHCTVGFSGLKQLTGGVFDSEVAFNRRGFYFNQSTGFAVENTRIRENQDEGLILTYGSSVAIGNCEILDNGTVGVGCLQGSSPLVEGCRIGGHQRGVYVELKSHPVLVANDIRGNDTGIWAEKLVAPQILRNRITENRVGIFCNYSAYPQIHENDLAGNTAFAVVLGDQQSILVEKQIPYRAGGAFYQEAPPAAPLPAKTRKFEAFSGNDNGWLDARGNWWGEAAAEQMRTVGDRGNIDSIEDGHDKPDTHYQGQAFARDVVVFSEWESAPLATAGPPQIRYAGVAGKILFRGQPLSGARVHVYRDAVAGFRGEGVAFSGPVGEDGRFALQLLPGRYYVVAKRTDSRFPWVEPGPGDYFSYYGGNPVRITEGNTAVVNLRTVQLQPAATERREDTAVGVLEGSVTGPEGPVEGAAVYLYHTPDSDFRGPDLFGPGGAVFDGTAADGGFRVEVPPGTYYLVATQRRGGFSLGPLRPGDLFGYYAGNPVEIAGGQVFRCTLQMVEKLKEAYRVPVGNSPPTGILGTIRTADGEVPGGVFAFASENPMMLGGMPPFRSEVVSADGSYFLDLPAAGTYYVGARSGYGGPPRPGEWHGAYGAEALRPVVVEAGTPTRGIDITVQKMQ